LNNDELKQNTWPIFLQLRDGRKAACASCL